MIRRDPMFLLGTLLIPVLSVFIFGYLFTGELNDIPIGVVNEDGSPTSLRVVDALRAAEGIDLSEGSRTDELKAMDHGDRWAIIAISRGFESNVTAGSARVEVFYNASNLAAATAGRSTVQSIVDEINYSLAGTNPLVSIDEKRVSARELGMTDFIIPGLVGLTIMFSGLQTSLFLVTWRQQGVLRRFGVTPLRPFVMIASQMAALLGLIPLSSAIILVLAWLLFGLTVEGSLLTLAALIMVGGLCMLSLGYFIGARVRTAVAASAIVQLVSLSMLFLGGTYFPVDSPPAVMEPVIRVISLTHLNDALRLVINDGGGFGAISTDLAWLGGWAAVTMALSARIFRWE